MATITPAPAKAESTLTVDEKIKYTTPAQLATYPIWLEKTCVKKESNPEGFAYVPVNLQPRFYGVREDETVMQFYVEKWSMSKDGQNKLERAPDSDLEHAKLIPCEEFLKLYKRL